MLIAAVVADANVLLSAAVGKAALRVFTQHDLKVHAAAYNINEVAEYLPLMVSKYELPAMLVEMQWRLLKIRIHEEEDYAKTMAWARRQMGQRDPDDLHPLALARSLRLPLWTNDKDLSDLSVTTYSTAQLLRILETSVR